MRNVSQAYKDNIMKSCGDAIHMKVNIGLINHDAQDNAFITSHIHSLSDGNVFGDAVIDYPYATFEKDFFKIDGMMMLPSDTLIPIYFNGIMGDQLSDEECNITGCCIEVSFPSSLLPLDIKGITLKFYTFFPVEFDVEWNDQRRTFYNDSCTFITDEVFEDIRTTMKIVPKKMNSPYSRMRFENIQFGINIKLDKDISSAILNTYTHPISNELPYKDFTVTVIDMDNLYDLENPHSSINFMEQMQEVTVKMGLDLPDKTTEWIDMETLYLTEWNSAQGEATFKARDTLAFYESEYVKGQFCPDGITFYDLAVDVLTDMGFHEGEYTLDTYLKTKKTKNPLPICKHKEALQIIANAAHCYLSQDAQGRIYMLSNFNPDYEFYSDDKTEYTNLGNVKHRTAVNHYFTFENHVMPVDGSILLYDSTSYAKKLGYVSNSLSMEGGVFENPPMILIQAEARIKTFGLMISFSLTIATSIMVKTYRNKKVIESLTFDNTKKQFRVVREWKEFDCMEIYFVSVERENQRIYVDGIQFGDVTDYHISNHEFIDTTPRGRMTSGIRNLMISSSNYAKSDVEETLVDQDITYETGQEEELYKFNDPVYDLRAEGCEIIECGTYYARVIKPPVSIRTTSHIKVYGKRFNITENDVVYKLEEKGIDQPFANPLIDSIEAANALAKWIGDFVIGRKDYSFDWRGDPAVECNDLVYIQNTFLPNMKLRVLKNTLHFDGGALNGHMEGRKVGDG